MVSDSGDTYNSDEVSAYIARDRAKDERLKAKMLTLKAIIPAVVMVVVSLLVMIGGIKLIGQAQEMVLTLDGAVYCWDTVDLEYGIFGALIGTLALALSTLHLASVWRRRPRGGP